MTRTPTRKIAVAALDGGGGTITPGQNILVDGSEVSVGVASPGDFGLYLNGEGLIILALSAQTFIEMASNSVVVSTGDGSASVQIGTAEVQLNGDAVRLGGVFIPAKYSTGGLPDPVAAGDGAIAYDSSTHALKISDGATWLTIAAS